MPHRKISIRLATMPLYPPAIIPTRARALAPSTMHVNTAAKPSSNGLNLFPSVVTCTCANQCGGIVHNAISRSGAGMLEIKFHECATELIQAPTFLNLHSQVANCVMEELFMGRPCKGSVDSRAARDSRRGITVL